MFYPQEVIEEVRMGNDIVEIVSSYVPLKHKGGYYFGLCPFHREKSPSFSVSPDKQMYHCFGCGAGGNAISFVMQVENYSFPEALKLLADRINYRLPESDLSGEMRKTAEMKQILLEIHIKAARFYYDALCSDSGGQAYVYLDNRGLRKPIRKKFGLGYSSASRDSLFKFLSKEGYSSDAMLKSGLVMQGGRGYYDRFYGRIMFPIFDIRGSVIGFGGRLLEGEGAKYLNSPETLVFSKSRNLYGLNFARKAEQTGSNQSKSREIILVEGYMDVLSLFQAGFKNVSASLGTAFNEEHSRILKKYCDSVILLFDSDDAGTAAALRAIPVLKSSGLKVRVQQVNGAKDPDEYIKEYGAESFNELLIKAKNHVLFQIDILKKKYNLNDTDQRVQYTNDAANILSCLDNAIERDAYIKEVARTSRISPEAIFKEVDKTLQKPLGFVNTARRGNLELIRNNKLLEKGLIEAKKSVLQILSLYPDVCTRVRDYLAPEEMAEDTYIKLIKLIYEFNTAGKRIYAAEILNYFETTEEHKQIADIFQAKIEYDDIRHVEKAVNDSIKVIKRFNLDRMILDKKDDMGTMKSLVENKRNIDKLYITISDG